MSLGKVIGIAVLAVAGVGLLALAFRLVAGLFGALGGLINLALGVVVVVALVLIVVWMFHYASKNAKK